MIDNLLWMRALVSKLVLSAIIIGTFYLVSVVPALASPITPGSFSTTWKTDNAGVSASNQITIPTTGSGYNYDVYWEEVGNDTNNGSSTGHTGNLTITFPSAGTYRVDITGVFPRIYSNRGGDRFKILTVEQWGSISWTSFEDSFYGAVNLTVPATDAPDLTQVTSLRSMFRETSSFNQPLNNWNVSNVTDMFAMFVDASSFNQPLNNWNVSNVTNMFGMFSEASSFNQPLNNWNVSNVTNMSSMFISTPFNQPLNLWNVSNVTNMTYMFNYNGSFNQPLNNWNVSNVTNMTGMFSGASSFNQPLNNWNVSSVVVMTDLFSNAISFNQPLNLWNVSNVTDMTRIFQNSSLQTLAYSAILDGWGALPSLQSNVTMGTVPSTYCSTASSSRARLVGTYSWTITDSGSVSCHSVVYASGLNATLIGIGSQTIISGQDTTAVQINPDAGYRFVRWSDNRTDNPRTDTNVIADLSVSAVVELITYDVTYSVGSNATLNGAAVQSIASGQNTTAVQINPDPGYQFVRWSDNRTDNPRTDTNVTADLSVSAVVELITYNNVTYSAGSNATLSGAGVQAVASGQDTSAVQINPDPGYQFVRWSDNRTDNPRTDTNVTASFTVNGVIELIPSGGSGGGSSRNRNVTTNPSTSTEVLVSSSTPLVVVTNESFLTTVSDLIVFLKDNQSTIEGMSESEKTSIVNLLQMVVLYIMSLLVELKA